MPSTRLITLSEGLAPERFRFVTLGCKVNRVEADMLAAALASLGSQPGAAGECDLVVVNTCTVTGEADKKARKAVRRALADDPNATVVVTGCAAAINPSVFEEMDPRVAVVGRAELIDALCGGQAVAPRFGEGFRARVGIKVQDGCANACTYCIVHVARGVPWSMPLESVLEEAAMHLEAGASELVLTGINLGSYRSEDAGLVELCEHLLDRLAEHEQRTGHAARVRLSSIEPLDVTDALIALMAESDGRICRHLHIPLQAGSSRVLAEMARPYDSAAFLALVERLRRAMPGISLSTDIICGFPGETEEDFAQTLDVAAACRFSKIHVFPYSARTGTPAAERTDQVPPEVKQERAARLRALASRLRDEDRALRAGTSELALAQGETAITESYHEVAAPADAAYGSLVTVEL